MTIICLDKNYTVFALFGVSQQNCYETKINNTYSGREMDPCPRLLLFTTLALAAALKMLDTKC